MTDSGSNNKSSEKAEKLLDSFTRKELLRKDLSEVVDMFLSAIRDLKTERNEREKLQRIVNNHAASQNNVDYPKDTLAIYKGYAKNKSWVQKLCFILQQRGEPMSFVEIKSVFFSLQPELKDYWSDPDNYISQILRQATKREVVVKARSAMGFTYRLNLNCSAI